MITREQGHAIVRQDEQIKNLQEVARNLASDVKSMSATVIVLTDTVATLKRIVYGSIGIILLAVLSTAGAAIVKTGVLAP